MRLTRFLVPDFGFGKKEALITDPSVVHQIRNILHLKSGERFTVFDGQGTEAQLIFVSSKQSAVRADIEAVQQNHVKAKNRVVLYAALLKKDNFEWALQKATEVGAETIVPLITKRTVKLRLNEERMGKILQEAAEQSGRSFLPILKDLTPFSSALNDQRNDVNVFFDPSGELIFLREKPGNGQTVGIWIGPEGGWDAEELEQARQRSFWIASFGQLVLRAETAVAVGCYLGANM